MMMPFVLTQTRTLVHEISLVTGVPSNNIIAETLGFSLSIVDAASTPRAPTSSGHDALPTKRPKKKLY